MRKRMLEQLLITALVMSACSMANPAYASEFTYHFSGAGMEFGVPTSTEEKLVETAETMNHNRSKTAAYIPPVFGSMTSYTLEKGERLTPNLLKEKDLREETGIKQTGNAIAETLNQIPQNRIQMEVFPGTLREEGWITEVDHTFYYAGGQIGYLDIPKLELSVKVYEGETAANMKKGVAHIKDSSVWSGNVVLCGHNRGDSAYFNKLHTLKSGDRITYTTKLGQKVYEVISVEKIRETDTRVLEGTSSDYLTLLTCVRNESAYRYCVKAIRVV
ncbi:MAG TPA: sortase [Lachnospiraceae bacterium]|nr:sortase [Lachnospiraceae bacterium]